MRLGAPVVLSLLLAAGSLNAAVTQTLSYRYHHAGNRVAFEMAITPEQDVLSVWESRDGNWHLTRVREWHTGHPVEQTLDVPGFEFMILRGAQPVKSLSVGALGARLFVTPDGRFAVCVVSAGWRRGYAADDIRHSDIVSVIDLHEWHVVRTTIHDQAESVSHGWIMERTGELALFETGRVPRPDSPDRVRVGLTLLDVPGLNSIGECHYAERFTRSSVATLKDMEILEDDGSCDALIKRAQGSHASSLAEFRQGPIAPRQLARNGECSYAGSSPGDQFEMESCMTFDRRALRPRREDIYSSKTGAKVGSTKADFSILSAFAFQNGQTYLLTLESGTHLRVYSITE
ncbi:MAG: hypothetical protein ABSG41_11195 [Bryobacteraceae bacterium]